MKKLKDMSINLYWKTQVAAGSMMMSAMAAASPNPINAPSGQQFGDSVTNVNTNISGLPMLLLNGSQIAGIFFGYKAWDNWSKVQKGNDPEAKPGKTFGYGVAAVGGYFLPSFLGMGGATLLPGV